MLTLLFLSLFQNGDFIEGICSVSGIYTTLVLFEKKTPKNKTLAERPDKRSLPPSAHGGKRLFLDEANNVSSVGYYKLFRLYSEL